MFIWIAFLAGLTFVFGWLLNKQHNPNQSNITRITSSGDTEVVLKRNKSGHYVANGTINGQGVQFFLDTGATHVSVPEDIANRIGLKKGESITTKTANGSAVVFTTWLEQVGLGNIEIVNVSASINPWMDGPDILLGMSFLKHLELVQRGDTLRLRVPAD